jgi:hypothetical protein
MNRDVDDDAPSDGHLWASQLGSLTLGRAVRRGRGEEVVLVDDTQVAADDLLRRDEVGAARTSRHGQAALN